MCVAQRQLLICNEKKKNLSGRADNGQALQDNLPRRQVAKAARHDLKRALEWESRAGLWLRI